MSTGLATPLAERPNHVPSDLVVDFDFYNIPGSDEDIQSAYAAFQKSFPDIFWTPHNGGHWVATRAEDILVMQKDHQRFSYRHVTLPPMPEGTPPQIPLELDPPMHAHFRRPLVQALQPGAVAKLEQGVHDVCVQTIEALMPRGECEFVEEFAKVLPITVFLRMVNLPIEDKDFLLPIAEASVRGSDSQTRVKAMQDMGGYLYKWIEERRENPGDDLLSLVVNTQIRGERISVEEATSYAALILFGGLDTVAGMLSFFARFLATHDEHRQQIIANLDDEVFLKSAIEELIRRHGMANTARLVTHDFDYKGITFKAGDRLLPPNLLVGMDDRLNPDPATVDFARQGGIHAAFGNGPHACPGAILARRELRIFLREWLSRIPDFRIKPGSKPVLATGQVNGILKLDLVWP
ncbi:cytochrome P450 [Novosphingobium taihuense]|uniref:Cytochrome P450 n=1 Tax=Novosphingobium taihuense TaxID=260085 RepID=A0A7W7AFD1_9SPHN|nr:cytochrome P450 [Novosphingobium taihuense]MBB4615042.1 cytochrome P450 [Novosphingobium taihuense]TWH79275.1 cytochrome P450 [Novosphingobium taihuense]